MGTPENWGSSEVVCVSVCVCVGGVGWGFVLGGFQTQGGVPGVRRRQGRRELRAGYQKCIVG